MKYAVEMGSSAMKSIPGFIEIGSGIPKLIWRGHTDRMEITQAYFRKVCQKLCGCSNRHDGSHERNCRIKERDVKTTNFEASREVSAKIVNCWVMTTCNFVS
jgi:hypothetical protein